MEINNSLRIVRAEEKDAGLILSFIKQLAAYERLTNAVIADENIIRESFFCEKPSAECILAYYNEKPVGFAIYFYNFSSFLGKPGLYLEDLFVIPEMRGKGFGKELLKYLARTAVDKNCGRMEWAVLDWNEPSINFYKKLGAEAMDQWTVFRLRGDSLNLLAKNDK